MGRHGPLTSMALGRSPYDDVVMGEGEGDPRAPLQMYDERGRPVNPETKRINRDIIRSHNEVMLVIGVVESENTIDELRAEQLRRYAHERYDQRIGRRLEWVARACELGGVWGVGGTRQRILLYREYEHVPFSRLFSVERSVHSPSSLWLHGLPAFVVSNVLDFPWFGERIMKSNMLKVAYTYLQNSLKIWLFLQRTHLLPSSASQWFPSWRYFIPFSSESAIPPCPLPSTLTPRSLLEWAGSIGLSMTPFLAFWVVNGLWISAADQLFDEIYAALPNPSNPEQVRPPGSALVLQRVSTEREVETTTSGSTAEVATGSAPESAQPIPPQDTNAWEFPLPNDQAPNTNAEQPNTAAERSTTPPDAPSRPRSHPRRAHAPNNDDFSSDDEGTEEVVSATLISFDVENNPDSGDLTADSNLPPGVWSAELRPNPGNDSPIAAGAGGGAQRQDTPIYRDNALTQLPATIAAGIVARRAASIMMAPLEASAMRQVAALWCHARGWETAGLWEAVWFWPFVRRAGRITLDWGAGFSLKSGVNFLGLELVHLLVDACLWGFIPLAVSRYMISDEDWEKREKEEQQQQQSSTSTRDHARARTA